MKPLVIICLLYLLSGTPAIVRLIGGSGAERALGLTYATCATLALCGTCAAFKDAKSLSRSLFLWAIGIPALVYTTHEMTLAFPTFLFRFPIVFGSTYSNGQFTKVGIDIIPGFLFILVWIVGKSAAQSNRHAATNHEEKGP